MTPALGPLSGGSIAPVVSLDLAKLQQAPSSPAPSAIKVDPISSPVLTTDELYQAAGWIGGNHSGNGTVGPVGPSGLPLFDVNGFSSPKRMTPRSQSRTQSIPITPTQQGASSLLPLLSTKEDLGADSDQQKAREIQQALVNSNQLGLIGTSDRSHILRGNGTKRGYEDDGDTNLQANKRLRTPDTGALMSSSVLSPNPPSLAGVKSPGPPPITHVFPLSAFDIIATKAYAYRLHVVHLLGRHLIHSAGQRDSTYHA